MNFINAATNDKKGSKDSYSGLSGLFPPKAIDEFFHEPRFLSLHTVRRLSAPTDDA